MEASIFPELDLDGDRFQFPGLLDILLMDGVTIAISILLPTNLGRQGDEFVFLVCPNGYGERGLGLWNHENVGVVYRPAVTRSVCATSMLFCDGMVYEPDTGDVWELPCHLHFGCNSQGGVCVIQPLVEMVRYVHPGWHGGRLTMPLLGLM